MTVHEVFIAIGADGGEEREALSSALRDFHGFHFTWFNVGEGSSAWLAKEFRSLIDKSDLVILVFTGGRDTKQGTWVDAEIESAYEYASVARKSKLAYAPQEAKLIPHAQSKVLIGRTFAGATQLAADVAATLRKWQVIHAQRQDAQEAFQITFAPQLTKEQVAASLEALADYYRACGGAGLEPDIELVDVLVEAPVDVLA
jgi:hypothetical protein